MYLYMYLCMYLCVRVTVVCVKPSMASGLLKIVLAEDREVALTCEDLDREPDGVGQVPAMPSDGCYSLLRNRQRQI